MPGFRKFRWLVAAALVACFTGRLSADLSQPGPYPAGWRQVTVTRANNTTFTARLFYPGMTAGQNAALNGDGAPYAAVSFGHGFFQAVSKYQSTLEHLATHGYLVIASDSEGGLFPSHQNLANDMSRCLTYLEQENARSGSFLESAVDTSNFGLSGHSMGGGCAVLAASADARLRAVVTLAAANTNPSAVAASPLVTAPSSFVSGSQDSIVPVGSHGQLMYGATVTARTLPLIIGGFHCGFTDSGGIGCDTGSISRATQLAITRRVMTEFFNLYLKGDQTVWSQVWGPSGDSNVARTDDPNVSVSPGAETSSGRAGAPAIRTFVVTNTGPNPGTFSVFFDGSLWPVAADPPVTPVLAPGQSFLVSVRVTIPALNAPEVDELVVSVRADSDGGSRGYATLTVRGFCASDFDLDGFVTGKDFDLFAAAFETGGAIADFDGDGFVTGTDFDLYVQAFEAGC